MSRGLSYSRPQSPQAKFRRQALQLFAALIPLFANAQTRAQDINKDLLATGKIARGAIDERSLSQPARNTIFSCNRETMGVPLDRPWVDPKGMIDLTKKPVVEGSVYRNGRFLVEKEEETARVSGNGLPSHPTGRFPVERGSAAFPYDRNPNSIQSHVIEYLIPSVPRIAERPGCLSMGVIGIALTGGVLFNALDAPGRDAVATELFDRCEGHPERNGRYHYHYHSPCFDQGEAHTHSPLIGYALDGFGIYGWRDQGGVYISNGNLDECHGHKGLVPAGNGGVATEYHYHMNHEFPYTLGCFRGVASPELQRPRPRPEVNAAGADFSVITLGTGGPLHDPERAGPSVLVRYENTRFLVDMGRDTQMRLQQANVPLRNLTALMLTHHHLDHNEEFAPILLKARLQGGAGQIVGPPGTKAYTDFTFNFYKEDSDYRAQRTGGSGKAMRNVSLREINGGETFTLSGVVVKTARVNHTIHTVAYRFEAGGRSVVISGDLSFSQSLIDLARGSDVLIIDSGQIAAGNPLAQAGGARRIRPNNPADSNQIHAHSTVAEVAAMAERARVKQLVLTHFASSNVDESSARRRIAETYKGEVIFARDLLEVTP